MISVKSDAEKLPEAYTALGMKLTMKNDYQTCSNNCIFCLVDQLPKGLREEFYFKDDDSVLSARQGNYVTLTNLEEKDVDEIIEAHLSPIQISVHTTNPALRCRMMNNAAAGEKLKYLRRLYDGKIEMNGNIVCCKNVNDGAELLHTLQDLAEFVPYLKSVSVVPAGITKFREGL